VSGSVKSAAVYSDTRAWGRSKNPQGLGFSKCRKNLAANSGLTGVVCHDIKRAYSTSPKLSESESIAIAITDDLGWGAMTMRERERERDGPHL